MGKKKYIIFLLLGAAAGVLATLGIYKIAARFIIKGYPIVARENVVEYSSIPNLYTKNIAIIKPEFNYIENGKLYEPVIVNSNLSAFIVSFKLQDGIEKSNISITLKSLSGNLSASSIIAVATTNYDFRGYYTIEDLVRLNYGKDISLKYLNNDNKTYNIYILGFKECRSNYYYCKFSYLLYKNETSNGYFYVILLTEGTGSSRTWDYEIDISP